MVAIVTRAGKGSPLTNAEVDANFVNLNSGKLETSNNLSDLADASAARTNLGLGSLATLNSITSLMVTDALGYTPVNKAGDTITGDVVINTKLAVGTSITANTNYRFGKGITGGVSSSAFVQNGNVQSDVTTTAVSFNSQANTAAASFTLTNYFHYYAQQGVVGAGSSITAITGFYADNTLAGATNTYGFRGAVGSGSGKWNLYMDGTAANYLAGATTINNTLTVGSNPAVQTSQLNLGGYNQVGGVGYHGFLAVTNTLGSATNPNKFFRLTSAGAIEIVNSAYSSTIFALSDAGVLSGVTMDGSIINTGTVAPARLGSGTADSTTYLRGDGTWATVSGGVTSITAGTGLSGGTITTTGTIALANTAVTAGSYTNASITVDAQGRITSASSGSGGGVTSFNTRTGAITLTSGDVTTALGFTPYNSSNPSGFITSSGSISGNAATASNAAKFDSSVRCYNREWIEMPNYTGLYSPLNGAHFYPNNLTYGSWRIDGSRNSWSGIEFGSGVRLMMNSDSHGFHNTTRGWGFYNEAGNGYFPGNVTAYWSDERLKTNLRRLGREALSILGEFDAYRYNWNERVAEIGLPIPAGKEEIGLIAQHVQRSLSDAVVVNKAANRLGDDGKMIESDFLTINYDRITPLLVAATNVHEQDLAELRSVVQRLVLAFEDLMNQGR